MEKLLLLAHNTHLSLVDLCLGMKLLDHVDNDFTILRNSPLFQGPCQNRFTLPYLLATLSQFLGWFSGHWCTWHIRFWLRTYSKAPRVVWVPAGICLLHTLSTDSVVIFVLLSFFVGDFRLSSGLEPKAWVPPKVLSLGCGDLPRGDVVLTDVSFRSTGHELSKVGC